jgi:hypothetical protein
MRQEALDFAFIGITAETENKRTSSRSQTTRHCTGKEVRLMLPAMVLLGIMFFTWGAAVWATLEEDNERQERPLQDETLHKWAA